MKQERKSSIYIILAGIFWGLLGIFVRKLSYIGFNTFQIAFVRMLFATIIFALYLLIFDKSKFKIDIRDLWIFVGCGLFCIFLHNITFFYAVINGEASVASILVYTSPIWVMLVSTIVFKEKITKIKLTGLILTFTGCVFVSGVIGGKINTKPVVILIGVSSGFFYGMYTIFSKIAFRKYSNETINMYTFLFSLLGSTFLVNLPETFSIMCSSWNNLMLSVSASVIPCLIPFILYTLGLKYVEGSKAAIMVCLDPIVGSIIGIIFLKEDHSLIKIIGIVLVLVSIILLNIETNESEPE